MGQARGWGGREERGWGRRRGGWGRRRGDGEGREETSGEYVPVLIPYGIKLQVVGDTQPEGEDKASSET